MLHTTLTLLLDDRKPLASGKYPVKIRATRKESGKWKTVYLLTDVEASHQEWEIIRSDAKTRDAALIKARHTVVTLHARALDIVKDSPFLSLDSLKTIFYGSGSTAALNVQNLYAAYIEKLTRRGQYGTSKIYFHAAQKLKGLYGDGLTLQLVDRDFLEDLEARMKIRPATVGMYMRTLKRIFNLAIEQRSISRDLYPFGSRGYTVPSAVAEKRSLLPEEKSALVKYVPDNPAESAALDVWRFSYYCNGMNMADMARLRRDQLAGREAFSYSRKKTARTRRDGKLITVWMRKEVREIIKRAPGHEYVFGILDGREEPEQERKKVLQWTKTTNKYLKRIGERLGLSVKLTTYVARHTAATMMALARTPLNQIRDALGHDSIETTDIYLGTLNVSGAKKVAGKL